MNGFAGSLPSFFVSSLYVFTNSLTLPNVSLCHSRFSLSVIPDIFNRESRVLCQADPHA